MKCPSCGAEVRDFEALFCARCGRPLPRDEATTAQGPAEASPSSTDPDETVIDSTSGSTYDPGPAPPKRPESSPEGAATAQQAPGPDRPSIESPYGARGRGPQQPVPEEPDGVSPGRPQSATLPLREFAVALRDSFVSGGWAQAAGAAAIGFLTLIGLGALIVAAAAIGSGGFGPGINAFDVLSLVVLFGLSVLGVSLEFGNLGPVGLSFSMVWLGALAIFGYALMWATSRTVAARNAHTPRALMIEGAKVALPFSLYCLLAALLFKISDVGTLGASAPQALFLGFIWAALFGAVGGLRSRESPAALWGGALDRIKARRRSLYEGIAAAGVMLGTTALASAAAFLLIVIVALARGDSLDGLTIGGVIAGLIVLLLTLPNVLSLIAASSLGAPLSLLSETPSGTASISIIGFGGRTSGSLFLLLLLIPLLSCLLGGFSAYRQSVDRSKLFEVLMTAAVAYAGALALLALLNGFSFEGGVEGVDIGVASTNFFLVAILALVWGAIFGFAGWKLAEMQDPDSPRRSSPPRSEPRPSSPGPGSDAS
ncbi:MAG: zinc-ribbon domain-containing protein [Actinomycetota bacterium]